MKKNKYLKIIHTFLCSIGLNILKFRYIFFLPKYLIDLYIYKKKGGEIDVLFPIISDHNQEAGNFDKQYFSQDLIVAQEIFSNNPIKHIDIGSRIDGFVSNVASFRKIEVFDIRPCNFEAPNIKFNQIDFTELTKEYYEYTDSISCLHSIEHFGLGRYGDKIDPNAHIHGLKNLENMLQSGGYLYLSTPISNETKIYFNSERVFDPFEILEITKNLELIKFNFIDEHGRIFLNYDVQNLKNKIINYSCGIFIFKKK